MRYVLLETDPETTKWRSTHSPVHSGSRGGTGCSRAPRRPGEEAESDYNPAPSFFPALCRPRAPAALKSDHDPSHTSACIMYVSWPSTHKARVSQSTVTVSDDLYVEGLVLLQCGCKKKSRCTVSELYNTITQLHTHRHTYIISKDK